MQFLLVSVDRYVEKNRMLAGDQAVYPTGFVFSLENGNPRLLFDENYLSRGLPFLISTTMVFMKSLCTPVGGEKGAMK